MGRSETILIGRSRLSSSSERGMELIFLEINFRMLSTIRARGACGSTNHCDASMRTILAFFVVLFGCENDNNPSQNVLSKMSRYCRSTFGSTNMYVEVFGA